VGHRAKGTEFFHEWGPFFAKTWTYLISTDMA